MNKLSLQIVNMGGVNNQSTFLSCTNNKVVVYYLVF